MPMNYEKLFELMRAKGYTSYRIRKEKVIGQSLLQKLRDGGDIDTRTIAKFCRLLKCQPGDLMEYIDDEPADE
jgi:Predicted transcriptional regulator